MKKLLLIPFITASLFAIDVAVSILPQKFVLERIAKDKVDVLVMSKNSNPHSFEPKPRQMMELSKKEIYFAIGLEFEDIWLDKFKNLNKNLEIVHLDANIKKISMSEDEKHHEHHDEHKDEKHHEHHDKHEDEKHHEHHDEHEDEKHHEHHDEHEDEKHHEHHDEHKDEKHHEHHDEHEDEKHHEHDHSGVDRHVWFSLKGLEKIAFNAKEALIKKDKSSKEFYENNYLAFVKELKALDKKIVKVIKKDKFIVFHPSFGYFAKDYDLVQIPIEIDGKEPKPAELIELISISKEYKIDQIIVEPQFSQKSARVIAKEINAKLIEVNPLSENILIEIEKLANSLK